MIVRVGPSAPVRRIESTSRPLRDPSPHQRGMKRANVQGVDKTYSWEESSLAGAVELLGGSRLFKQPPASRADVHAIIVRGIPYSALFHLASNVKALASADFFAAVGVSERSVSRQKNFASKLMPTDIASKTWQLAETLAKAMVVMGGKDEAESWMSRTVMGLDGARPIDLLLTLQGAQLVSEFLERLEYGVYN